MPELASNAQLSDCAPENLGRAFRLALYVSTDRLTHTLIVGKCCRLNEQL